MTRICTVCAHPERREIDKALVAAANPYRDIARQYGLSKDALLRHKADHLLAEIVAAWQAERQQNGLDLATELRGYMDTIGKLLRACDEWLTDPDDPDRYYLGPRAADVWVVTETDRGPHRRPERKKERLSALLARVDGKPGVGTFVLAETKSADPRKLILDTAKTLEGHLRLMGEILGKLQTQGTANFLLTAQWVELRTRMLAALADFPQARIALAAALEGGDARAA